MAPHVLLPSCSSPCRPAGSPESAQTLLEAAVAKAKSPATPSDLFSLAQVSPAPDATPAAPASKPKTAMADDHGPSVPSAAPVASRPLPSDEKARRTRADANPAGEPGSTPAALSSPDASPRAQAVPFRSSTPAANQPPFEPSDAQIAEALLMNGYRISEDTAGDADFTFPLDFQTPLNYEIYSFISQCLNAAQLKQSLSEQGAGQSASDLSKSLAKASEARGERREAARKQERRNETDKGKRKEEKENAWPTLEAGAAHPRRPGDKRETGPLKPSPAGMGKQGRNRKQWKAKEPSGQEDAHPYASPPSPPESPAPVPAAVRAAPGASSPEAPAVSPIAETAQPGLVAASLPSTAVRAPPGLSGPDVNTALLRAAFLGREDIVDLCLKRGGDVSFSDRVGRTALHYGAATGTEKIVRKLLEAGGEANINKRDRKHWTPLLIAVTKTHSACVRLLLEKGAEINATLCHRCAPCRSSAQSQGARADLGDKGEAEAAKGEAADAANEAGERKEDVDKSGKASSVPGTNDPEGPVQTWSAAIHFAAIKGNVEISKLLLDYGATVNDVDSDNRPPLHYAACRDNSQYVSWLLSRGARLDLFDVNGRSALHAAAIKGQLQNAQSILEAADPVTALLLLRRKDKWDITPAQLAKLHGQNGAYLLLKSYADQLEATLGDLAPSIDAENADVRLLNQTITEVLATGMQEVKKNKLERTVARLGTVTCLKAYQKTMMVQGMGGMLVADGSRPKTAGGVFFTLLREMARQGEISREDLIYIEMEDGEAKKALRRRARQKQTASAAVDSAPQVSRRAPNSASSGRTSNGGAARPSPTAQAGSASSGAAGNSRFSSARPGTRRAAAAKPQENARAPHASSQRNSVGFFLSPPATMSSPNLPPRLVSSGTKTRPGSALSSKSSGASTVGGCTYTPLAQAINAETLSNSSSRGSSPQQQTPTNFPSVGSFVGTQPQGFYPFSMYPVYPFWSMGFPTPLSPPPIMGANLSGKEEGCAPFFSSPSFFAPQAASANTFFQRGEKGDSRKKNATGAVPSFPPFFPGAPGVYLHPSREESDVQEAASKKKGRPQKKKEREEESKREWREEERTRGTGSADREGGHDAEGEKHEREMPGTRVAQARDTHRQTASPEKPQNQQVKDGDEEDGWKVVKSRHAEKRANDSGKTFPGAGSSAGGGGVRGRGGRGRGAGARGRGGRRNPE
ncbi:hypothetical protein NCLIV_029290 [Neospora caninum Liverpool]|uniref:Ankyrin repeat-containing protein n=1 Tax=Neospora caninum (strain Liverpool) TaxID=572307 RepID=F0VHE8_NEOCL|nr:hypothetical protein NCLIV_029290 [Neospora caninum Liverpool]CBZ53142.1 hypothetical protein NCLIV_029290 [Neospora caninum Liverpool]CEL67133.1 TPA: ankyrin repeat-containing protein [Neospora caninum Liverpool]|eukprot:XP_003883174.1 hypothetical protein NCLIV_029290 [Neospora caninum Liverpool]